MNWMDPIESSLLLLNSQKISFSSSFVIHRRRREGEPFHLEKEEKPSSPPYRAIKTHPISEHNTQTITSLCCRLCVCVIFKFIISQQKINERIDSNFWENKFSGQAQIQEPHLVDVPGLQGERRRFSSSSSSSSLPSIRRVDVMKKNCAYSRGIRSVDYGVYVRSFPVLSNNKAERDTNSCAHN